MHPVLVSVLAEALVYSPPEESHVHLKMQVITQDAFEERLGIWRLGLTLQQGGHTLCTESMLMSGKTPSPAQAAAARLWNPALLTFLCKNIPVFGRGGEAASPMRRVERM